MRSDLFFNASLGEDGEGFRERIQIQSRDVVALVFGLRSCGACDLASRHSGGFHSEHAHRDVKG